MIGLGNGHSEWMMEEKFEKIAEAGFTGIMGSLPEDHEAEKWKRLLGEYKLMMKLEKVMEIVRVKQVIREVEEKYTSTNKNHVPKRCDSICSKSYR
ncbi:hypothetical protein [Bacillus sp. FSL K6-3431]|uniref:hypothetical protein n=1 Tax=Bacillus sp. FSL K6-3431 TaxID=2921500 RepID=UPI0030F68D32